MNLYEVAGQPADQFGYETVFYQLAAHELPQKQYLLFRGKLPAYPYLPLFRHRPVMFIQSELRIQPPIECPEQQKPENPLFLLRQSSFPVVCLTQSYFQVGRHMVEKQPVIIGVPLFQGIYLLLALDLLLRHGPVDRFRIGLGRKYFACFRIDAFAGERYDIGEQP